MDIETIATATSIGFGLANGVMLYCWAYRLLYAVVELVEAAMARSLEGACWLVKQVLRRLRARK